MRSFNTEPTFSIFDCELHSVRLQHRALTQISGMVFMSPNPNSPFDSSPQSPNSTDSGFIFFLFQDLRWFWFPFSARFRETQICYSVFVTSIFIKSVFGFHWSPASVRVILWSFVVWIICCCCSIQEVLLSASFSDQISASSLFHVKIITAESSLFGAWQTFPNHLLWAYCVSPGMFLCP